MLTVLIATHNGSKTLPRVLESYNKIQEPLGGWCLIVVDNASSDNTSELLKKYSSELPLEFLRTEQRGKNIALNLGLDIVKGDLVVFTDDDVIPSDDWLVALRNAADINSNYDIFSGRIEPIWPTDLPDWIPRLVDLGVTYAVTPRSMKTGPNPAKHAWGPNMAIRAEIFRKGYKFNEGVGPNAGQYIMGSETEFTRRLEENGHRTWFSEEAVVGHIIRRHQLEREWIIKRAYRHGRSIFREDDNAPKNGDAMLWGVPRWRYRYLLVEYIRLVKANITKDFDNKFLAQKEISFLKGYLHEARSAKHGNHNERLVK